MSFKDLGSKGVSGASRRPERGCEGEVTSFEQSIKVNIQEMQDLLHRANEHLEQSQRSYRSKRSTESLDGFQERGQELSRETTSLFRDWTVHLAGEPGERHRKKFSYEKLQRAFEQEVIRFKDVARKIVATQKEAVNNRQRSKGMAEFLPVCDEQSESLLCPQTDVEHGVHDEVQCQDAVIRSRIAQEREEGIRRIQGQVHEVNQIFRDLASIVHEQGNDIESIEHSADSASRESKQAASELRKAADRQRGSRERLCCMLTAATVLLFLIVLPHMHMSEFQSSAANTDPAAKRLWVITGSDRSDPLNPIVFHYKFFTVKVTKAQTAESHRGKKRRNPDAANPKTTGRKKNNLMSRSHSRNLRHLTQTNIWNMVNGC